TRSYGDWSSDVCSSDLICRVPARPIHDEAKVLVSHGLLGTGVSGARPHSAGWHVPVAGFGLKPMVGSMQRTRVWLAHCVGCRKHAIRSGSCWTAVIFGPRGFVE